MLRQPLVAAVRNGNARILGLRRVVLVRRADRLVGPCGAGLRVMQGAQKSCVLVRDDANSCADGRVSLCRRQPSMLVVRIDSHVVSGLDVNACMGV